MSDDDFIIFSKGESVFLDSDVPGSIWLPRCFFVGRRGGDESDNSGNAADSVVVFVGTSLLPQRNTRAPQREVAGADLLAFSMSSLQQCVFFTHSYLLLQYTVTIRARKHDTTLLPCSTLRRVVVLKYVLLSNTHLQLVHVDYFMTKMCVGERPGHTSGP